MTTDETPTINSWFLNRNGRTHWLKAEDGEKIRRRLAQHDGLPFAIEFVPYDGTMPTVLHITASDSITLSAVSFE